MDYETDFDPTFSKKKKKVKRVSFIDDDGVSEKKEENGEGPVSAPVVSELEINLEDFGKKKKKKKIYNLDELGNALPVVEPATPTPAPVEQDHEEIIDLDIDFSTTRKKKKTKKRDLEDLVANKGDNEALADKENANEANGDSGRDYTYDELARRIYDRLIEDNPEMATGRKTKLHIRPPQVLRVGSKKSSFCNFVDIAKSLHRQPKHLLDYLLSELGTSGSLDGSNQLIIKGRFQGNQIENVIRRYAREYVYCRTCRSIDTQLTKKDRITYVQCNVCNSESSVTNIKSGFQAVTTKRATIRARNA